MHISGTWERLRPGALLIAPSRKAIRVKIGAPLQQTAEDNPATLLTQAERAVATLLLSEGS